MSLVRRSRTLARVFAVAVSWALLPATIAVAGPPEGLAPVPVDPDAIIGGFPTAPGTTDAAVGVGTNDGRFCTGTVVAPRLVLTAAHCLEDVATGSTITIFFGEDVTGMSMTSTEFAMHPRYCPVCTEERYDFAYVKLPQDYVPLDGYLLPITDQREWNETMRVGNVVRLVGFGLTDPDRQSVGDKIKHEVTVTIDRFTSLGSEFFAGGFGRDTCSGDSGGPVVTQLGNGTYRLAGVTSRGGDCGQGGWYGVPFTSLLWLRDHAGVDLLPVGCAAADCVDLTIANQDEGRCAVGQPGRPNGWGWMLLAVAVAVGRRRRLATDLARPR